MSNTLSSSRTPSQTYRDSLLGVTCATTVIGGWIATLWWTFHLDPHQLPLWAIAILFLLRTFQHTGLFITAHDAMHGSACPANSQINRAIGAIAITLYALLPYNFLCEQHGKHHDRPATDDDPDYCRKHQNNAVFWYLDFMIKYMKYRGSWLQLVAMTAIFHSLWYFCSIPFENVLFFWGLPTITSSVQMFYFGVFLTHREPPEGFDNIHRARSSYYSMFWSFVTCYHFGYHLEHHQYPHLPWYKLPYAVDRAK